AELYALGRVFAPGREKPLRIGSIKSNLGHLEAGAGIAGLIKTILALRHDLLVPNLHYNQPCETLAEYQSLFEIPTQPLPWPRKQIPRRAGISSFGFSGNNAHVILEEAPVPSQQRLFSPHWDGKKPSADRPIHVMAVSAISDNALRASTQQMADWLSREDYPLADTCFTMNTGRAHLSHRFAVCGGNPAELRLKLQNAGDEQTGSRKNGTILFFLHPVTGEDIVALREFTHTYPLLHAELESCDEIVKRNGGQSLFSLFQETRKPEETEQNVVFQTAIAYSLFKIWAMWGVMPAKLIATPATLPASLACSGKISLESSLGLALLLSRENNGDILDYLERTQISKTNIPVELETVFDSQANGHILQHVQDTLSISAYAPRHNDNEYGMDLRIGRKTTDIPCFNWRSLCETLCELYMAGWDVDWDAFDRPYARNVVCDLPTYPFQREIYYNDPMEPLNQHAIKNNGKGKGQGTLAIQHHLHSATAGKRKELLETYVHDTAFQILGNAEGSALDRERPLIEQGFDSLTTVELRNRLAKELQLSLPVTLIFNYPTISAIRDYLIDVIPWDSPEESLPTDQLSLHDDKTSESDLMDRAPDEQGNAEMQFLDQMNEDELQKWIEDDLESF
ncbi:hypothetical protein GF373_05205, partial [bacterium]|nr:hypothetical protein [bacterium]